MSSDLKIRVISNLLTTEFFTLYQQDINLNVKNFKIGAWDKQYISPGAVHYTILPSQLQAQGRVETGAGIFKTKLLDTDYNHSYEIFENDRGLDIKESNLQAPTDDTINIYNTTSSRKDALVLKGGKPVFSASIRPGNKLNFSIRNSIYITIIDYEISSEFFNAVSLYPLIKIDYEGQSYLTIILKENLSTSKFDIEYNFNSFEYPNE